jgi:hypothetical protein
MLEISTIQASAGASSSTWATTGSTAPVVAEGLASSLLLIPAARRRQPLAVPPATQLLRWWELDYGSSQSLLPPCPRFLLPLGPRGRTEEYPATTQGSTVTSWAVDSVTFSFLAERFRATLCGLLGGMGMLASKLAGLSTMRGILGCPGRLNLDRS